LFSIFINSICDELILYADDLAIYTSDTDSVKIVEKLQREAEYVHKWLINFDKTKLMVFHKEKDLSIRHEKVEKVDVYGNQIERIFEFKDLGLIFDPHMKFYKHFEAVQQNISQRLSIFMDSNVIYQKML